MNSEVLDKHGCTGSEGKGGCHLTPRERAEMPAIVARWIAAGRITVKRDELLPSDKAWAGNTDVNKLSQAQRESLLQRGMQIIDSE